MVAPVAKEIASFLPSTALTFAAVILIKPGGIIPIDAITKPNNKGTMNSKFYLILKRIYVIALFISKYCFS